MVVVVLPLMSDDYDMPCKIRAKLESPKLRDDLHRRISSVAQEFGFFYENRDMA
jgi:hypothetical protein